MNNRIGLFWVLMFLISSTFASGTDHGDEHGDGDHDEHGASDIKLTAEQIRLGGIKSKILRKKSIANEIKAPGEIRLNQYATIKVTSRINAQIIKRYAKLGDYIKKGQRLVTLSSVEMAEAQGELLVAAQEWSRVKKLGRKVVSERRYITAKVAHQRAKAKVRAYGMSRSQMATLLAGNFEKANGEFQLFASQSGIVIDDAFIVGEMINTERVLFTITDESVLWVEAKVSPEQASLITTEASARIKIHNQWLEAKVIQIHHQLDEKTRTQAIRLAVKNNNDQLHPGLFVMTAIQSKKSRPLLSVPTTAVLRSPDGDYQVFIEEESGVYEGKEVEVLRTLSGLSVIEGIDEGSRVVIEGAFFLQSEQAKSGFEIHNH